MKQISAFKTRVSGSRD